MDYRLQDLIDIPLFQALQDKLNEIYSFPSAIIDNEGNVLTATAWQDVCTKFHRAHPECEKECRASDLYILEHLDEANPAVTYQCPHGLVDNATPIVIGGKHLGNYFTGQFFLAPPDLEFFRAQARRYGFGEEAYLAAVARVPVWSEEKLHQYLDFIKGFTEILAGIGYKQLQENEARRLMVERSTTLDAISLFSQQVVESVDEGVIVYGPDLHYRLWNPCMERLSGLPAAEVVGRHPLEVFPYLRDAGILDRAVTALAGHTHTAAEFPLATPSGETRWMSERVAPLLARNGAIVGAIATVRDVTASRRALQENEAQRARAAQGDRLRALGEMATGIAHELTQPLNGIRTFAEGLLIGLARQWTLPPEELRTTLADIVAQVDRMSGIIDHMREFARDQRQQEATRFRLDEVVSGALKLIGAQLRMHGISVRQQVADDLPTCLGWPHAIEQVMLNLLSNARDALDVHLARRRTGEIPTKDDWRPEIVIRAEAVPLTGAVRLEVADNGSGIPAKVVGRIFDPFFTTKEVGKGTGIGLTIARSLVERHGGRIEVDNRPDDGAVFIVILPAAAE